jgi:DHA1 family inner membrane transport protein
MPSPSPSLTAVLTLLCAACFLASMAVLMLGPLLVALAHTFQTSVAVVGQLMAATAITWGLTAPVAGPVADAYGRRSGLLLGLLLLGLGLLGSAVVGTYTALLLLRLLTGVGAALVPPNTLALIADVFPPTARGKAIGWVISTGGLSAAGGVPLVACLLDAGGWRLPFAVIGLASLGVWLLAGAWLPRYAQPSGPVQTLWAHYRAVGSQGRLWYILGANMLQQIAFFGMFGYLAASLMQRDHLLAHELAFPLALAGAGVVLGGYLGGRVADHPRRVAWLSGSCWSSGVLVVLVFILPVSLWGTVTLACGMAALSRLGFAVTPLLVLEMAGPARTTATGLFATSNQLGIFGGATVGGVLLAWGGFPWLGWCYGGVSMLAAVVIHVKVQDAAGGRGVPHEVISDADSSPIGKATEE